MTRQDARDNVSKERWELRELEAGPGRTPSQSKTSYDFGIFAISPGTAPGFLIDTTHSLRLRLYRPGFKTVDLEAVEPLGKVFWEPASDVLMRETALDELFGVTPVLTAKGELAFERVLEPGSKSKEHLAALQFGIAQYAAPRRFPGRADQGRHQGSEGTLAGKGRASGPGRHRHGGPKRKTLRNDLMRRIFPRCGACLPGCMLPYAPPASATCRLSISNVRRAKCACFASTLHTSTICAG